MRGIDLVVAAGRTLGIVGESGSGKSVTAFAITRLLDRGRAHHRRPHPFRGRTSRSAEQGDCAHLHGAAISMIFQNPRAALNPIRTVGLQIADALRAHREP